MAKDAEKKPSSFEAIVGKKAADKIGTYQMSTGGGTPIPKGEKMRDHPEYQRDSLQPRDEDGKFTYNSANGMTLKYGPSRGVTVPPFLKGIELNFAEKKPGKGVVVSYQGKIYLAQIQMNEADFVKSCKEYLKSEGGFKGLTGRAKGKVGARSKEEKQALENKSEGIINDNKIDAYHFTAIINNYKDGAEGKKLTFAKTGNSSADITVEGDSTPIHTRKVAETAGKGIRASGSNKNSVKPRPARPTQTNNPSVRPAQTNNPNTQTNNPNTQTNNPNTQTSNSNGGQAQANKAPAPTGQSVKSKLGALFGALGKKKPAANNGTGAQNNSGASSNSVNQSKLNNISKNPGLASIFGKFKK